MQRQLSLMPMLRNQVLFQYSLSFATKFLIILSICELCDQANPLGRRFYRHRFAGEWFSDFGGEQGAERVRLDDGARRTKNCGHSYKY